MPSKLTFEVEDAVLEHLQGVGGLDIPERDVGPEQQILELDHVGVVEAFDRPLERGGVVEDQLAAISLVADEPHRRSGGALEVDRAVIVDGSPARSADGRSYDECATIFGDERRRRRC